MSTTYTIDTATSRANSDPGADEAADRSRDPRARRAATPLVMLTAYTVRTAQLLDPHCDLLLVGDSLGQVIYGLPSTVPVTLEMMAAHGAAVVRGSYHAVVVDRHAVRQLRGAPRKGVRKRGVAAQADRRGGGEAGGRRGDGADRRASCRERGIPVMGHVGLTPQAVNTLGGYGARGRTPGRGGQDRRRRPRGRRRRAPSRS